ncbi:MAG: hypothetical protein ACTS42_00365 [Candidatus Hodgkinia cicadicola]
MKPIVFSFTEREKPIKLIDNLRMVRRVIVGGGRLYIGIACKTNITIVKTVAFVFVDNWSYVDINILSVRLEVKVGYKSKLKLNVNSILKNLTIIIGPKSKLIVTTNGILQSFNLNLNIKLLNRSEVQVNTNVIVALNSIAFTTNAIALEQFTNVKLVYNVLMLKQSLVRLNPTFELRGKTTKCVHSIFVDNRNNDNGYASNRLVTPEVIGALMFYSKCTT